MDRKAVLAAKEGGRRKLLCLRFPRFYGYDQYFVIRTLTRGEIHLAYQSVGYINLKIPPEDPLSQALLENCIFEKATLRAPQNVTGILDCPAGLVPIICKYVLYHSGFTADTKLQYDTLRKALQYANSQEGRNEALVLHYLPGVSDETLKNFTYEELHKRTFQAIMIAGTIDGIDLGPYLRSDSEMESASRPRPRPFVDYNPHTQAPPTAPRPPSSPRPPARSLSPEDKKAQAVAALQKQMKLTPQLNKMLNLRGEQVDSSKNFMFMAGETVPNVRKLAQEVNQHARNPEDL